MWKSLAMNGFSWPLALHACVFPAKTSLCKVSEASIADQV